LHPIKTKAKAIGPIICKRFIFQTLHTRPALHLRRRQIFKSGAQGRIAHRDQIGQGGAGG
jgi:hypothetical protein